MIRLIELQAGQRFRVCDRTGTLVRATASRAVVRWDAELVEGAVAQRAYLESIASNCEVDVLPEVR